MARTVEMFPKIHTPRRVLMHVYDASGDCCADRGDPAVVVMACGRCGHKTDWISLSLTEAKRGIPCPVCNEGKEGKQ